MCELLTLKEVIFFLQNGQFLEIILNIQIVQMIANTHGDVFKPQGISASKSITITNVAKSQYIGHNVLNTSGSRYFNFIDWDSSITGKKPGQPALVGSNELWWKFDNTCEYNQDWTCFVCEKGDKEIANIQFYVPGLIDEGVLVYDDFDKLNVYCVDCYNK
ncbi:hypothetical protein DICPUDRAFT_82636 [Dictyostelium purpureum]|uniref:Uncharacterized protein n=1 Tax=Dictyostelium purpureum TaxID=5786 RepID=F0ZX42_DICPU|nr:uncharacterized protein DICPUDRAFT_82636 [Dictyostelium purpureum]EGC31488.1 hypothetical protein DICPUDRAFT_82636 [Dictyostelium purpureum]|eukprot:XP_003291993.1 hypothetical protein DICPUDRAFT_82636 [Dictyostelium purpureum]